MTSPTSRMPGPGSPDENPGASVGAPPRKPREVEELVDEYVHRPLARGLVALLVRSPITPNQVTLISGLLGVAAGLAIALGAREPGWRLVGALLLLLSVVFDCCDGQLARAKQISSTTGAILDGITDYVVGVSVGVGASYYLVTLSGNAWYWLLGLGGIASSAVQAALFDHTKTRYIARVSGGYSEREEDLAQVADDRRRAIGERRYAEGFLLWVYERYSRAQHATLQIPPVADLAAYRSAHAGRMRLWTLLGIGTHFALAYILMTIAYWWAWAAAAYFIICLTLLNVLLLALVSAETRPRPA